MLGAAVPYIGATPGASRHGRGGGAV